MREHPLRERLRGQLMLALYRSGRQADALEAYQDARRELLDELGLEPGRALQELERAILAHDPGAGSPRPPATARRSPAAARNRRRGAAMIAAAGALLLAAIAAVAVKLASSGASTVRVSPNSVAAIDTRSDRVVAAVAGWCSSRTRSRSVRGRCGWRTSTIRRSRASIRTVCGRCGMIPLRRPPDRLRGERRRRLGG